MRLVLALKSIQGIKENSSNHEVKNQAKNAFENQKNGKNCSSR
jgi:hypothetical protein